MITGADVHPHIPRALKSHEEAVADLLNVLSTKWLGQDEFDRLARGVPETRRKRPQGFWAYCGDTIVPPDVACAPGQQQMLFVLQVLRAKTDWIEARKRNGKIEYRLTDACPIKKEPT